MTYAVFSSVAPKLQVWHKPSYNRISPLGFISDPFAQDMLNLKRSGPMWNLPTPGRCRLLTPMMR